MQPGFTDLIWLLFLISMLQPMFKRRMIEAARLRLLRDIERREQSRVIVLIHRQEALSFLGIPMFKYINIEDAEEVLRAIYQTDNDVPIDIVLHTPGGLVLAATQIARALAAHPARVRAIIPHYAMSGGTLIALAANEIIMSPHAVLGPVDPQLGDTAAASLLEIPRIKPAEHIDDRTLIMVDMAEKALEQVRSTVRELLEHNYPAGLAEQVAGLLSEGHWTHDYALTFETLQKMGLHVRGDIDGQFLDLLALYPQPMKQHPSVEYLPGRHTGGHPAT